MDKSNTRQITLKPTKDGFLPAKTKPNKMVMSKESMGEWKHINWRKLEKRVFKLQKRIYKASLRGDVKAIHRLQKTLMLRLESRVLLGAMHLDWDADIPRESFLPVLM